MAEGRTVVNHDIEINKFIHSFIHTELVELVKRNKYLFNLKGTDILPEKTVLL